MFGMADTVQELLEDMVPELEDLARKRIFSTKEIKEIVRKRRDFEYKLKRRESQKSEYLRYIAYESALDKLRNLRKKRLGYGKKSKSSVSDFSMQKRLHFIFDRMLRKWKGDVALWMQYIDFCIDQGANKMLHSVLARALQYHPRDVSLWIRAATWHFDDQGDIKAARVMCQRGLRMIDDSVELWCHYLRLELCYIDKLRQRQRLLGIEGDMPAQEELEAALDSKKRKRQDRSEEPKDDEGDDSDGETGDDTKGGKDRNEEAQPAASGARALAAATLRIASVITDNARKTVPDSLPLLLGLASVCVEFPHTELLEDKLFAEIAENFPGSREGWTAAAARAKVRTDRLRKQGRPVALAAIDAANASAVAVFQQAAANPTYAKEPALWEAYTAHAKANLASAPAGTETAQAAESELREVYGAMRKDTSLGTRCPEGLLSSFVMDLASMGDLKEAMEVAKEGCKQLAEASQPLGRLVQLYFNLAVKTAITSDSHAPSADVKDALNGCTAHITMVARQARVRSGAKDAARRVAADPEAKALADATSPETLGLALLGLWGDYLEYLLACDAAEQDIGEAIEEGVESCKVHSVEAAAVLRHRQLHWVCANNGMKVGRELYRQMMRNGERVTTGQLGMNFLRGCIALEMDTCAVEGRRLRDAMEPVRWLFEAAVRLDGKCQLTCSLVCLAICLHCAYTLQSFALRRLAAAVGFVEARDEPSLWLEWIRAEESWGAWDAAGKLYFRATHSLAAPDAFVAMHAATHSGAQQAGGE